MQPIMVWPAMNSTLNSNYLYNSNMVVLSEYIQIAAAGIYSIALFYTIVTFRRTKRLDQISRLNDIMGDLLNDIMGDLRDLDRGVIKILF
jgi:hypothetical protein